MGIHDNWEYEWPRQENPPFTVNYDGAERGGVDRREADDLKALLNFCVNNRDLDLLYSLTGSFNPLRILGVADYEIRHSNVLGWLLDPKGHHGFGDTLFKNILLEILRDNRGDDLPKIEDVIGASFTDLKVLREWANIDVLCISPSNKLLLVIENKIFADEDINQLTKYAKLIEKRYPGYQKVYVFLTVSGESPKGSDRYIPFKHEKIYDIVKGITEIRKDYMHSKVYDFTQQYLQILEEKTMPSKDLVDICTRLYREHGDAIKMILQHGKPKLPMEYLQRFHNQTNTESIHTSKENVNVYYTFIPKAWSGKIPETNKDKSDRYLVYFKLDLSGYENYKISLSLMIGEFPDTDEREQFMTLVSKASKEHGLKFRWTMKYTTITSETISLRDDSGVYLYLDDYETVTGMIVEAYNSSNIQKALSVVDEVVQDFQFADTSF